MKGDKIPDSDHIARYCKPATVDDGQIQATAFMVKENEESLSVNWLESLNCSNRESELAELRRIFAAKLNIKASAKIAVLNVGAVCEKALTESPDRRFIEVLHDPTITERWEDPSHSGIYKLREDDELIAELILETIKENYPARG